MQLYFKPDGSVQALYGEAIDLAELGGCSLRRASHVEPAAGGGWAADLSPVGGPLLGPFRRRSEALRAEEQWLNHHLEEECHQN